MPKSKAEMMKRLRRERKKMGLVEARYWVSPEQKRYLDAKVAKMERQK